MNFKLDTFKVALWAVTDKHSEKAPSHKGTAKFGSFTVPVVCWYDDSPENRRPNISISVERGYVMPSDREDRQGESVVDWNLTETDRAARLDAMETALADLLEKAARYDEAESETEAA